MTKQCFDETDYRDVTVCQNENDLYTVGLEIRFRFRSNEQKCNTIFSHIVQISSLAPTCIGVVHK